MLNWNKKERPLPSLLGMGGGAGGFAFGGGASYTVASGGVKIPATTAGNGYNYHVFATTPIQDFTVTKLGDDDTAEILVVGGGGSGGYFYGAGGGAGGIVHSTSFPLVAQTYKVRAGGGAAARATSTGFGNNGVPSYFKPPAAPETANANSLIAYGGGGGGYSGDPDAFQDATYYNTTGSGGGSVSPTQPNINPNFGSTTQHPTATKYSNPGGRGSENSSGGGGGGAGAAGSGATGGAGRAFPSFPASIIAPAIPTSPFYGSYTERTAFSAVVTNSAYYGGGGSGYQGPNSRPLGGGGNWAVPADSDGQGHGVPGTGGGGTGPAGQNGIGGRGIVIIRYLSNE